MSVVKKYEVKTDADTVVSYDIGAEAANVSLSDGSDLETVLGERAVVIQLVDDDLDDIATPGFYNAGSNQACTNAPYEAGRGTFGMIVVNTAGGTSRLQMVFYTGGTVFYRWCTTGTWSDWARLYFTEATTSNAGYMSASDKKTLDSLAAGNGVAVSQQLSAAVDLDTLTTPGFYMCPNGCTNGPSTAAMGLIVEQTSNTYFVQYACIAWNAAMYWRFKAGSSADWGAWTAVALTDTTYAEATTSAAGLMSADDKLALDDINRELYTTGVVSSINATDTGFEYTTTTGAITAVKVSSTDDNVRAYSEEPVQIGTWIDGSPVWRKCGCVDVLVDEYFNENDEADRYDYISGITCDDVSAFLKQTYYTGTMYNSYADLYEDLYECVGNGEYEVIYYCVEYVE